MSEKKKFSVTAAIVIIILLVLVAFIAYSVSNKNKAATTTPNPTNTTESVETTETTEATTTQAATEETTKSYAEMTPREVVQGCTTDMATEFHIHSHVTIIVDKQPVEVPAEIGIDPKTHCMSSIHTHQTDGIIHIEAPVKKDFTLDDFFYNWKQPFNKNEILGFKVDADHGLKMFVNSKESSDFEQLLLQDHQEIVIDYYNLKDGPDVVDTSPKA